MNTTKLFLQLVTAAVLLSVPASALADNASGPFGTALQGTPLDPYALPGAT